MFGCWHEHPNLLTRVFRRANRDEGPGKVLVDARYSTRFKESFEEEDESRVLLRK